MVSAHGALATIAFVAILPAGGLLIRFASSRSLVWIHAGLQAFGYAIFVIAVGLGIYMAVTGDQITSAHAVIGLILFVGLVLQPITGLIHHTLWRKHGGGRTLWSYAHLIIGRIAIILGIINGGLGLALAGEGRSDKIAYGVIVGIVGVVYFALVIFGDYTRIKGGVENDSQKHARQMNEMS